LESITSVGDEIRQLKAAKADKDSIKTKVDELLALKTRYQELTGHAPGAPVNSALSEKKENKSEKKESKQKTQKKDASPAPTAPQTVNAAAPAPKPVVSSPPVSVWVQGNLNLEFLEAKLKVFSYVSGYEPTADDHRVLAALNGLGNVSANYPQISRWHRNVSTFSEEERANW